MYTVPDDRRPAAPAYRRLMGGLIVGLLILFVPAYALHDWACRTCDPPLVVLLHTGAVLLGFFTMLGSLILGADLPAWLRRTGLILPPLLGVVWFVTVLRHLRLF